MLHTMKDRLHHEKKMAAQRASKAMTFEQYAEKWGLGISFRRYPEMLDDIHQVYDRWR
jgi:hypothetical protein